MDGDWNNCNSGHIILTQQVLDYSIVCWLRQPAVVGVPGMALALISCCAMSRRTCQQNLRKAQKFFRANTRTSDTNKL
jgi:hypothetical protein